MLNCMFNCPCKDVQIRAGKGPAVTSSSLVIPALHPPWAPSVRAPGKVVITSSFISATKLQLASPFLLSQHQEPFPSLSTVMFDVWKALLTPNTLTLNVCSFSLHSHHITPWSPLSSQPHQGSNIQASVMITCTIAQPALDPPSAPQSSSCLTLTLQL